MRLIITNDGLYGVDNGHSIVWFNNIEEAYTHGAFCRNGWELADFNLAVNECFKNRHDVAEFGVNGTFMYTTITEDGMDEAI